MLFAPSADVTSEQNNEDKRDFNGGGVKVGPVADGLDVVNQMAPISW
jgi:hypothetical protein